METQAVTLLIREGLDALGVERFVLGVQEASLPGDASEDIGRGSLASKGADQFFRFARALGFTGVQLGPMGQTSASNPSPYDGTLFSRSTLSLSLGRLVEEGWLAPSILERLLRARPKTARARVPYGFVYEAHDEALGLVHARAAEQGRLEPARAHLSARFDLLIADALYPLLCEAHGAGHFSRWTSEEGARDARLFAQGEDAARPRIAELLRVHASRLDRFALGQHLVAAQHATVRERARAMGLRLYGDLQIGMSPQDVWRFGALLLGDYAMGAPPSRTNPEGQPWGYGVLDPALYGSLASPGPSLAFWRHRVRRVLEDFDGLRVDHPHGLVCPWVYRTGQVDPLRAVQQGARLFESPDLADHSALTRFAIARGEQLDRTLPRHADGWVTSLTTEQVERYALLFDVLLEEADAAGLERREVVCEVLSTLPTPLRLVLQRLGLGRFRVTQKASLTDADDVYRSENALPEDWIMLGNHDTPPIWSVVRRWAANGELPARARYLAERLAPKAERDQMVESLCQDVGRVALAQLAAALASPARNVMLFFTDLFGLDEPYNIPGVISDRNWSLRVPHDYLTRYGPDAARGRALHIPRAIALALRSRGSAFDDLATRLERA